MEELKKYRSVIRGLTTKLINSCKEYLALEEYEPSILNENIDLLNAKYSNLKETDAKIHELIEDEKLLLSEFEDCEVYFEKIISMKSKLTYFLNKKTKSDNPTQIVTNTAPYVPEITYGCRPKIKLPKLSITKFNGDPINWMSFWNQYDNAIHQNDDLTDTEKFNYLISFLSGSAVDAISGFSLSEENYAAAIKILKERFGRNDLIINAHMGKLLNLEPVKNANNTFALRKLYDDIEIQIRSLESLKVTSGAYGTLLTPILLKLIPNALNLEFQRRRKSKDSFDVNELIEFLKSEIECREAMIQMQDKLSIQNSEHIRKEKGMSRKFIPSAAALKVSIPQAGPQCVFCEGSETETHSSEACPMSIADRKTALRKSGICYLCLKKRNHLAKNCYAKIKCDHCGWRHNSLICERNKVNERKPVDRAHNLSNKTLFEKVLLQTMVVRIQGNGADKYIRALIDTGSQKSYISKYLANAMHYECINENDFVHSLFGGNEVVETHKEFIVHLSSVRGDYRCNFKVLDQTKICSDIPQINIRPFLNELKAQNIFLNDVKTMNNKLFYQYYPSEIHLLIGADVAGKLLTGKIKKLNCGLVCVETYLGWNIMGKIPVELESKNEPSNTLSMFVSDYKISDLWKLDTLGVLDPSESLTRKELKTQTMNHFVSTVKKDDEGRFEVCLPWVENHPPLPSNREIAEKRLKGTVKNLKAAGFLNDYEKVFKSWEEEKIIELVPEDEIDNPCHYLPHRGVIRMSSKTTKIRPVFDGSAKLKGSPSINCCLEKGPNLTETVPAIINRFRLGNIGVSADIKKAFLQIGINPKDRDYLRFLWWDQGNSDHLKIFRHRRVVFDITSSPFHLSATLTKLMKEVPEHLRETADKIAESWYVDNLVTSVNNEKELKKLKIDTTEILASAKFELQEWAHNDPKGKTDINNEFSFEYSMPNELNMKHRDNSYEDKTVNILGLVWNLQDDTLKCDLKGFGEFESTCVTKRTILSEVHKIYDPVGFTCPVTVIPKILLQHCWELKVTWDEALPEDIAKKFTKWKNDANRLDEIKIPRCMIINDSSSLKLSFHVFCDASKMAYATCIYLRCENEDKVTCHFVQARSRVAPLKSISICRLELLACIIGVRLMKSVKQDLKLEYVPTFYWTDSMNTLYWIKNEENWGVFVMNRVKEIRSLSDPEEWNFVPGSLNAADIPSRGCSVEALKITRWHEGPAWLRLKEDHWPTVDLCPDKDLIDTERRKTIVSSLINNANEEFSHFSRLSSFEKIIRVTAWMKRFVDNCRMKNNRRKSKDLEIEEIKAAEVIIWIIVQKTCFKSEKDERIRHLKPFVDSSGVLKVKSRVLMRQDSEDFRTPVILPPEHPIVSKLIIEKHKQSLHCGIQTLMAILREKFWILKSRRTIRKILRNCVICKRHDSKPLDAEHAPLPEDRVKDASIFEVTGIDLAGPLYLKNRSKVWIVLFTCAVYRAVHLELVTALSTDNFLLSLRRFIARRGRPKIVYTDNGSNFIGTSSLLKKIDWDKVIRDNVFRIKWKFIPPASPWWGGFWERMIGLMKNVLRKVLGNTSLKYEELNTILCDCESILNCRPLTYVSEDLELQPLTPALFLRDLKESSVPDLDCIDSKYLRRRYIYRTKVREDLRKRFRIEYLGQLRNHARKTRKFTGLSIGDIVLIETNDKRINWPLGKITELLPGKDGVLRLAKLRTTHGETLRPIQRLYPLEVSLEAGCFFRDCAKNEHLLERHSDRTGTSMSDGPGTSNGHDHDTPKVTRSGRVVRAPKRMNLLNCLSGSG